MSLTIASYAKQHSIPITAIRFHPTYDEAKSRVSKGNLQASAGWTKGFQEKFIHMPGATGFMIDLGRAEMYVIDFDPKEGKSAKECLLAERWDWILANSCYVVETGSGGIHAYFRLPPLSQGGRITKNIKCEKFRNWFVSPCDVDVLCGDGTGVITEGSCYTYENKTYLYRAIKGSIQETAPSLVAWDLVGGAIYTDEEQVAKQIADEKQQKELARVEAIRATKAKQREDKEQKEEEEANAPLQAEEVIEHVRNIANNTVNWDFWYRMGQVIYNLFGEEGEPLFVEWSEQSEMYNPRATRELWRGLSERTSGPQLGIGTLLFWSKTSNPEGYKTIRSHYKPMSARVMKENIEINAFFVREPKPILIVVNTDGIVPYTYREAQDLYSDMPMVGKKTFFTWWSSQENKRTYRRIGYYPNVVECPEDEYNIYMPPLASMKPAPLVDLSPLFTHVSVMTHHNEEHARFFHQFFAQIIQQPTYLSGICMILQGLEGSGKDVLIEWIGRRVLGDHLYCSIRFEDAFKGFNGLLENRQLVHCQEVSIEESRKYHENFKERITNKTVRIERKNMEAKTIRSYGRYVITTNNINALKISPTDRRFIAFRCSPERIADTKYFQQLVSFLEEEGVAEAYYQYLLQLDISTFTQANRPECELLEEMKEETQHPVERWVADGGMDNGEHLKAIEWLRYYNEWATEAGLPHSNVVVLGRELKKLQQRGAIKTEIQRGRVNVFWK